MTSIRPSRSVRSAPAGGKSSRSLKIGERNATLGIEVVTVCKTPIGELVRVHHCANDGLPVGGKRIAQLLGLKKPLIVCRGEFFGIAEYPKQSRVVIAPIPGNANGINSLIHGDIPQRPSGDRYVKNGMACPHCGTETVDVDRRCLLTKSHFAHLAVCPKCRWGGLRGLDQSEIEVIARMLMRQVGAL